ncbi:MAG: 7-cyano-7-deazaguanine synthase [Syntrophomonadaceae bacterium]|nr:7-cyano-7-deazaguanine synthase [Bacillota bacterium]
MCSISGFIRLGEAIADPVAVAQRYYGILNAGAERGRDSCGIIAVSTQGQVKTLKGITLPAVDQVVDLIDPNTSIVVANNRAEPTTERVFNKTLDNIPPFQGGRFVVAHNGTIANDKELIQQLCVQPSCGIDSAVLPWLFEHYGFMQGLSHIMGSFALAAFDISTPRRLYLAKNYKPLVVMKEPVLGVVFFASREAHIFDNGVKCKSLNNEVDLTLPRVVNFPPYSLCEVNGENGVCKVYTLDINDNKHERVLVIASGGLDSTVAATFLRKKGFDVVLLHFLYGCHAEQKELQAIRSIAEYLECDLREVDLKWLGKLGGSSLTVPGSYITTCETGAEFPHEWVPARNMNMIAAACAIADAESFSHIALGTNLEESGSYPDNTDEFIEIMDKASILGTMAKARVIAPVSTLVKHEIVKLGLEIGAPLHLTWSCYHAGDIHCGECGPCFMRRAAFEANNVQDPVYYRVPMRRERPIE